MSSNLPVLKSILFQIMLSYLTRLYTNLKLVLRVWYEFPGILEATAFR